MILHDRKNMIEMCAKYLCDFNKEDMRQMNNKYMKTTWIVAICSE